MGAYSREELAERSGVPARTIRYYQQVGLLPKPERAGKEVVFDETHLRRLDRIAALRAQGLKLDGIRRLFDAGPDVRARGAQWSALFAPYDPSPEQRHPFLDDRRLSDTLGERPAEITDELVAAGFLRREGDGWRVPDHAAFKGALMLYDLGTDIAVTAALNRIIRDGIADVAHKVVETFTGAAGFGYAGEGSRADLDQFLDRFRAAAWEVGGSTFADEIEKAVGRLEE